MIDSVDTLYESIDGTRMQSLPRFFADDAELVFANQPPAVGHAAIEEELRSFRASIEGINQWRATDGRSARGPRSRRLGCIAPSRQASHEVKVKPRGREGRKRLVFVVEAACS